jgi:hypothetical protein
LFGGVKGFLGSLFSNTNAPINRDEHADTMLTEVEMAKTREKYGQKFGYMWLLAIINTNAHSHKHFFATKSENKSKVFSMNL